MWHLNVQKNQVRPVLLNGLTGCLAESQAATTSTSGQ